MSNLQAVSMQDTQPVRPIRRADLTQRTTIASGREGDASQQRLLSPFRQFVTPYVGLEAMRQFAEQMDKMP